MSSKWIGLPYFFIQVLFCEFQLAITEKYGLKTEEIKFEFTQHSYNATIVENSIGKAYVTPLSRMGISLSSVLPEVKYTIFSGDNSNLFKPEARRVGDFCFLRVRTRSGIQAVINREQEDQYRLTIRATLKLKQGPLLTANTELIINVIDTNDLSPLFDQMEYRVNVAENATLHQSVLRLTASDADIGINGEVYYSFAQFTETFAIHPTSGVVTVTRPLSFTRQPSYTLVVLARDRGPVQGREARVSRASLYISILEVNKYSPEINLQELPAIVEHGKVGTIYAVLHVTDRDGGQNGQIGRVEITAGDDGKHFKLLKSQKDFEFLIQVAKDIDRESYPAGFNLTVVAADKGSPPRSSFVVLHVRLQDTNDHSPRFPSQHLQASIMECSPVHTPVLFVTALDTDCGKNAELVYSIVSGNSLGLFSVNPLTGLVSVAGLLDAETWHSVNLTVQAQDLANRGSRKASTVKLQVNITDCNDNSPVFGPVLPVVYVDENQPAHTSIFHVEAHDPDSGENGFISYSLANVESVPFAIDHFKGDVVTKEVLDYESMRRTYSLVIRASDWGNPFRRETELTLRIRIRDVNDNRPQFEKVNCTGYLSKDAQVRTEILVVSAIDFDFGNIVSYHVISGNDDETFELDSSTGSLKLRRSLKGDQMSSRHIMVTASDGTNSADPMSINISLVSRNRKFVGSDASFSCYATNLTEELNRILRTAEQNNHGGSSSELSTISFLPFSQNLNSPRFIDNPGQIVVSEGLAPGTKVLTLKASDDDHGYNGRLQFTITGGNDRDVFRLDTYTGDLYVIGNLDREITDQYRLNLTVSDMGKIAKRVSMFLEVNVTDINDNAPEFNQSLYVVTIPENVGIHSVICTVKAVDRDSGPNGRVGYSLADSLDMFAVDARSGCISLVRALDREKASEYMLSVIATDRSSDQPLSSVTSVHVKVSDINDNAPKFYPAAYDIHALEDLPIGTVVTTLFASDPDVGQGGVIQYSIVEGADDDFAIDHLTGAVRIAKELNFEKNLIYNITARARDRGEPSLFSDAQLTIVVVDVNNNLHPPVFKDIVFTCHVRENQPPRTSVMQVMVTDGDVENPLASPRDFQIVYSIRNGTGLGLFTIDSKGMIYTRQSLDRETQTHYWLTVYVQDMGLVPLSSMAEVYIEIDDLNDNAPQTESPVYYTTVPEGSAVHTSVLQLEAHDPDDLSSNRIVYDITSGSAQEFFAINRTTGLITTGQHKLLDREKRDEHILEVTVSDGGIPPLSSVTRIVVKVGDLNDEEPKFLDRQYRVRIPRLAAEFLKLGLFRVFAVDRDIGANAQLDYSITPNKESNVNSESKFRIDSKTGMIYAVSVLEKDAQYDLQVKAADDGRPQLNGTARVILTVMDVPAASANPPKFNADGVVQVLLMESDEIGHLVSLLSAHDDDTNDKLWYFITGGNVDDTFSIDTENGNILLARLLDWEVRKFYNLTVEVTDGVHWTKTWVHVSVRDVNDNAPQFEQPVYEVNVTENAAIGTDVCTVVASDADEDVRLLYTIHSATSPSSLSKFRINSETGVIGTLEELNREAVSRHELTVMVRDQGALSKRSLTKVIIQVLDINDHAPEFLEGNMKGWVSSSAEVGSLVLQVVAYDADKGVNAEIIYSIASGNVDGIFNIDPTLGIILVAKSLENNRRNEYNLVVRASDNGLPSLSGTAIVQIEVILSNNSPPRFDQMEFSAEIAENQPIDSFIAVVRANCRSSVIYELVGNEDETYFNMNPSSGVLFSNAIFDYEIQPFYNLTVRVTSIMGPSAHAVVYVHITDVNDNAPVFVQSDFVGNISEISSPGSHVLDIYNAPLVARATDADSGRNCHLLYQIVDARAQDVFDVDSSTGTIRTKVILDRELVQMYEFTVQAVDHGEPPKSATVGARVRIYVDDANDSPPVFAKRVYRATLLLPTQPDVALVELLASDADSEPNAVLEYGLVGGNGMEKFALDPKTGILTVINVEEMLDSYELSVRVTDGHFEDRAIVQVSVDFRQASGLQFLDDVYEASIPENLMEVRNVTIVHAIGHALNEHLAFTVLNLKELFEIKSTSGVIQTTGKPFDREARSNYVLVVEVRDERVPVRIAHCLVNVTIADVNDCAPVFLNQPYFVVVSVDAEIGKVIKKLAAVDRDIGANGIIDFILVEGDETLFAVQETGDIVTRRALSAVDSRVHHRLLIEAKDRGDPVKKSRAEVMITIVDQTTPMFDQPFYSVVVPESLPLHSALIIVFASSPTGGKLVYSVVKGDSYGEFAVDFNTGVLSTLDHLDYEASKFHELTVRALDIQSGSYGDAVVQITVEDVNDNQPVFEKPRYSALIYESIPVGTSVLTVSATDEDSGNNAKVWYQIDTHPLYPTHSTFFHIDSSRGIISVKQKLDYEQMKQLKFVVVALDSAALPMNASVPVTISVADANDNPPKFEQLSYEVSISDKAKQGQFLLAMLASDTDSSDRGRLRYAIVAGNVGQMFVMDSIRGTLSVTDLRRTEFLPSYTLNVSVTDGVFSSFTRVRVNVGETNLHQPRFSRLLYEVNVYDLQSSGQSVAVVNASDEDTGNNAPLTYKIINDELADLFAINSSSGEIFVKSVLSCITSSMYLLRISATDGGGLVGRTTVRVNVHCQSSRHPVFAMNEYKANVYATSHHGSSVVKVTALVTDAVNQSIKQGSSDLEYSLVVDSNITSSIQYFMVDAHTGLVTVNSSLIGLENGLLQYFVRAKRRDLQNSYSDVSLAIYVMTSLDRPPLFEKDIYSYFVIESYPIGSIIAAITANSNDSLVYRIVPGNTAGTNVPPKFSIDNNGAIKIVNELDRESVEKFDLSIRAETLASPGLVAHTTVVIHIQDVNDNRPEFTTNNFTAGIAENGNAGAKVVQVEAFDLDSGTNGEIVYKVAAEDKIFHQTFSIDPATGWITCAMSLDRENASKYEFDVIATDRGASGGLSSSAVVTIHVIDQNDEEPVFAQSYYHGAVNEDALPGTIILTVTAIDRDQEPNNVINFYISEGDPYGQFNIRKTGEMYVNKELDRELKPSYDLVVLATDGLFVSRTRISITILDANDNTPVCDQDDYHEYASENLGLGSFVLRVSAQDSDEPGTRNSRIDYYLEDNVTNAFAINKRTGIITSRQLLDRETTPEYYLKVIAQDGGGLSCTSHVTIILRDINDNAPVFTQASYVAMVPENFGSKMLVARVAAIDADIGINRRVTYSMDGTGGVFTVDPTSGVITVHKSLDREELETFNLTVYASDQGNPRLSSSAVVTVLLIDVNDNPPEFERSVYLFYVHESASVGTVIGKVFAASRDAGVNAEITYTIFEASDHTFIIRNDTGEIIVSQGLDYEQIGEYTLMVKATDGGSPPLSSTAVVKINVTDENDNAPSFVRPSYQFSVQEDVATNTTVGQVEALDIDSGRNGMIEFHLLDQSSDAGFSIDQFTGRLYASAPLDREKLSVHELVIMAIDKGEPPRTASLQMKIDVTDVNDCHPRFTNDNFTVFIQAGIGLGSSVFTLEVSDDDAAPNGEPFIYDIIEGGQQKFFVDKGVVKTSSTFNRSIKDVYVITVRVVDNGYPPLYSDVDITIYITDQSISPPIITPLRVTVMTFDDSFPASIIGRMKAVDPDVHDLLTFSLLTGAELFEIDPVDGTLRATEALDAGEYTVNVSVTDGRFLRHAAATVIVEVVTSEMTDNAVVIRFENLTAEEFVASHLSGFVLAVKADLSVRERDVHVLSMQPASDTEVNQGRRRRNADSDLDVLIAVERFQNKYFKGSVLKRRLELSQSVIEQSSGLKINNIFNNACTKDTCKEGDCQTTYQFENDSPYNILTDSENYVIVPFSLVYKCVCKPGSTGPLCTEKLDVCNPGLCKEPKICTSSSSGQTYTCSCPEGRTGDDCNDIIEPPCTDALCRKDKPMTLSGLSYIHWRLTVSMERRLSLSLELKTIQANSRIFHAVGQVDYSILEIEDGFIQYRFDCGSGPGLAKVTKKMVNDGQWHTVVVERNGKSVRIVLDGQHPSEGNAPGTNDVLNLDSNDIFFGAEVELLPSGIEEIGQGFIGCLRRIAIDHVDLPLSGSSSVAVLRHLQDVEFHCRGIYVPGLCSSAPCRNGGSCFPMGADTFICKCRSRFLGTVCEIDTNPCASGPCLNDGECEVVLNNFKCTCPGSTRGRRCELIKSCDPNPCRNGARCSDDIGAPTCECLKGYQGEFCENDVDECRGNPCANGGSCYNVYGSFNCNCSAMSSGELCEVTVLPASSSRWNIMVEEIVGIVVAIVVLLIAAVFIVLLCRYCRHKRQQRRPARCCKSDSDDDDVFEKSRRQEHLQKNGRNTMHLNSIDPDHNQSVADDETQLKLSPQPPPLPKRPVSYTPSAAESYNVLNTLNPDISRNYGSAADDLESAGACRRTDLPAFLQAQKSPGTIRLLPQPPIDEDPTLKELNNLNKAENYRKNPKKLSKMIPSANPSLLSLQLLQSGASVSSLPVSESESDVQSYHWDMSDLNPNATLYLKSPELVKKIHALSSAGRRCGQDQYEYAENGDDCESDYVGDSELTENELGNEDVESDSYPGLTFSQIMAMKDELNYGSDEFTPQCRYNVHPNNYLPEHDVSEGVSLNGNINSADYICRDDDNDVIHYGFPRLTSASKFNRNTYADNRMDPNVLDNMKVSVIGVGGRMSAIDSSSDLAGVSLIEDSEAYNSEEDNTDETRDAKKRLLTKIVSSTQV